MTKVLAALALGSSLVVGAPLMAQAKVTHQVTHPGRHVAARWEWRHRAEWWRFHRFYRVDAKKVHRLAFGSTSTETTPGEATGTAAQGGSTQNICGLPSTGKTLTLVATAYGPSLQDNYPYGPVDYYGQPLKFGDVAVDPRVIPLGTHLYVTGYHSPYLPAGGFCAVARDTGGAIKGDRIDLFMNQGPSQVASFGIQRVEVTILK